MRSGGILRGLAAAGVLVVCASAQAAASPPAWTGWGNSAARTGDAATAPASLKPSFVLPLTGRITNQVLAADGAYFVGTSSGEVVSFTSTGTVRWRDQLGQLTNKCAQLDGYGITGTGVIDPASSTLYVMDAFGRLHALSLASGAERSGWPVEVFTDNRRELDWGALSFADGSVYVPTASYCDTAGTPGAVYRVDTASRAVTQWLSVPLAAGGGGGPWGWGGLAYDPTVDSLFAATSGAFDGGTNSGDAFTELTGHGDQLVQLSPDLTVANGNHPADIPDRMDLDFVGSPVLGSRPGCGRFVAATDKDDTVYLWREGSITAGPVAEVPIEPYNAADPMLAQLAWSPSTDSLYTATGTELVRITIASDCSASITWREPLGTQTENGSPTISGNTVWITVNGRPTLDAYDAKSGKRLFQTPLGGTTLTAPTIVGNQLVIGTFTGLVEGFSFEAARSLSSAVTSASTASAVSWASAKDAWETRTTGVYATENGGQNWHEIYEVPALAVLRVSASSGVIELGTGPSACMCTTRHLWTDDDGKTWHTTDAISADFAGGGGSVYWWEGGTLRVIDPFPPADSTKPLVATVAASLPDGTIVGSGRSSAGFVFLVSNRVSGQHWDTNPRVILANGASTQTVRLPSAPNGEILAESITADGDTVTVDAVNFGTDPVSPVSWTSTDGGASWSLDN